MNMIIIKDQAPKVLKEANEYLFQKKMIIFWNLSTCLKRLEISIRNKCKYVKSLSPRIIQKDIIKLQLVSKDLLHQWVDMINQNLSFQCLRCLNYLKLQKKPMHKNYKSNINKISTSIWHSFKKVTTAHKF